MDEVAPVGSVVGGALAGGGSVRGTADVSFEATDQGAGVYRVALVVDGAERVRQVVDGNGGDCADVDPANGDPYEFGTPRPCPLAVDGGIGFDTTALVDGSHAITVTIEDAAGNADVVFDGTVQTHNAPISTAVPGVAGQARSGAQLSAGSGGWDGAPIPYDYRWLRCDADGAGCAPVAGASRSTLVLTEADAYHRMRVEVVAANGSGSAGAKSAPTAVVADAAGGLSPASGGAQGGGSGGGGGGQDKGGGASGGIQGLVNPLAHAPGHVPNGASASAGARVVAAIRRRKGSGARRVRARHDRRVTIAGRLTDSSGAGIGNARLGVAWKIGGRRWIARGETRTDGSGRFAYRLPPGPSRAVRFAYHAFSDSRTAVLSNVVRAEVRAPITIRATPGRVTGARVVRLSGRVGGGMIPRNGALVTLQGFQRGWGWRTFRTVRTDRRGRWTTRYRFRLSSGRFGFRAAVPRQSGLPFAASHSRAAFVVVA